MVKNLPAIQEVQGLQVQSLAWEDTLEEGMAMHSSGFAWRIPWTEEPGGHKGSNMTEVTEHTHTHTHSHTHTHTHGF